MATCTQSRRLDSRRLHGGAGIHDGKLRHGEGGLGAKGCLAYFAELPWENCEDAVILSDISRFEINLGMIRILRTME